MSRHVTEVEFPVEIEYDYHPEDDGGREYPSTPAYVEIYSVKVLGVEVTLPDADMERIQLEIEEKVTEQLKCDRDWYADEMRENCE